MKNMIDTVLYWEHSSTLKVALQIWVRVNGTSSLGPFGTGETALPLKQGCLKLPQSLLFHYTVGTEDRRAAPHIALLQRNWNLSRRGSAHPGSSSSPCIKEHLLCYLHWKQNHSTLLCHKLTEKSKIFPSASYSKPDRPDINVLAGKPVPVLKITGGSQLLCNFSLYFLCPEKSILITKSLIFNCCSITEFQNNEDSAIIFTFVVMPY